MNEWVYFWLTAAALAAALFFLTAGVIGNLRFDRAINRIHAAGIGDTMGLLFTTVAVLAGRDNRQTVRVFLPLIFLCITSPVSSHFLALMEFHRMENPEEHAGRG